jgi:hypothetical protein
LPRLKDSPRFRDVLSNILRFRFYLEPRLCAAKETHEPRTRLQEAEWQAAQDAAQKKRLKDLEGSLDKMVWE